MNYNHTDDLIVRVWVVCTTLAMIYLPSQFVLRIYQDRAVSGSSIVPLVTLQGIPHVWILYSVVGKTWFPIFPCFLVGGIAAVPYLFIYWQFLSERQCLSCIIAVVYSILDIPTIYVIVGGLGYTSQTRAEVAKTQGYICDIVMISLPAPGDAAEARTSRQAEVYSVA